MPENTPTNPVGKIYALVDPRTGDVRYVGRTTQDPQKRLKEHLYTAIKRNHLTHKANWIRELDHLGLRPSIEILEDGIDDDSLQVREKYWVLFYREKFDLTNGTVGGEGIVRMSDDGRRNLSESLKGRVFSEEHKAKLKAARSNGNWKLTEEGRKALIARNKERKLSESHKQALVAGRKAKGNTPEHNAKIAASKVGKPLSEAHRKKLSDARKRYLQQRKESD